MNNQEITIDIRAITNGAEETIAKVEKAIQKLNEQIEKYNSLMEKAKVSDGKFSEKIKSIGDASSSIAKVIEDVQKAIDTYQSILSTLGNAKGTAINKKETGDALKDVGDALTLLQSVSKIGSTLSTVLNSVASSFNLVGAAISGVSTVYAVYESWKKSQEEETAAREERINQIGQEADTLSRLHVEYRELGDKAERTREENERLRTIMDTLSTQYGFARENLAGLNGSYETGNALIDARIEKLLAEKDALEEVNKARSVDNTIPEEVTQSAMDQLAAYREAQAFYESMAGKTIWNQEDIDRLQAMVDTLSQVEGQYNDFGARALVNTFYDGIRLPKEGNEIKYKIKLEYETNDDPWAKFARDNVPYEEVLNGQVNSAMEVSTQSFMASLSEQVNENQQAAFERMYNALIEAKIKGIETPQFADSMADAFSTDEVSKALTALDKAKRLMIEGAVFTDTEFDEIVRNFSILEDALQEGLGEEFGYLSKEKIARIMEALIPDMGGALKLNAREYFEGMYQNTDFLMPAQKLNTAGANVSQANFDLEQANAELEAFRALQDETKQGTEEWVQALQTLSEYRNVDTGTLEGMLEQQKIAAENEKELQEQKLRTQLISAENALQEFEQRNAGKELTKEQIEQHKELQLAVSNAKADLKWDTGNTLAAEMDAAADSAGKLETETDDLATNLSEMQKKASTLQKNLELKRTLRDNTKAQLEMVQAINKSEKSQEKFGKSFESLAQIMGTTDPVELEEKLQAMFDTASEEADVAESGLYDFYNKLIQTKQQIEEGAYGVVDIETQSALDGLIAVIAKLLQIDNLSVENGLKDERESGGGGGKSRKQREEEEAKRAAEEARRAQEEAYREALGQIDHLKKMDQLSGEQEIKMLLEVQRVHAQTAEQRMDMEERIYAARKELAEKQYNDALAEIDHLMALDQISAEEELKRLEQVQSEYVTTDEQRREMAEKVYASRKALQQQAYDDALEDIDRKMRMDEIGAEEEVALLEEVARVHAQTGEQRLDIEERLYAARKALAEQQYSDALSEIEHMLRMDEIGAEEELTMLEDVEAQYAQTAEQRMDMEERIYAARKQLQEDAFNDELSRIDRLKSRNEISTQEQIEQLERVAQTHAQTAEQREKTEDKLYQAQQALRKEEEASINRLNSGLLTALRGRYEEQRDAEVERLNESKQAWKDWSDVSCEAIQAQIDALDEQAEAEDREKTDAENVRAINKAQQALVYETDEYNRKQLEKQIAELEEKRAEQLKKWEVSDRKEALREEMENAKERAKAEQEAIQSEIDRVKELYAERLEAASLQAEAEQLLMKGNQEAILKLIESYAPDYEATGKTLGERLFEGIRNGMGGDITEWMQDTNAIAEQMRKRFIEQMQSLANGFNIGNVANEVEQPERKNINITQNINISNREDSPYEISRQVNRMGQKLADML